MGAPSPPPGRLSLRRSRPCGSCCWAAPEAVSPGDSAMTPVPFRVKPSGWPGLVLRDFYVAVGLGRIWHGLEAGGIRGLELHRLGKNDDQVLGGIERLGIDLDLAGVRQSELHLELGFSGAKREGDGVAVLLGRFFGIWNGVGADRLAVRGARLYLLNLCAGRP